MAQIKAFDEIWLRAAERKGGEANLRSLLPKAGVSKDQLSARDDSFYLSEITKAIFKAGFVWRVIDNKWANFEKAFWGFDIPTCLFMSEDDIDKLMLNAEIVRHRAKIATVAKNAGMIADIQDSHGSFGEFLKNWPNEEYYLLLDYLKKHGTRLGGLSCQYFLRFSGVDGYILGRDVMYALNQAGVVDKFDKLPGSKTDKKAIQEAFNIWAGESGFSLAELSRVLSLSVDAPR